MNVYLILRFAAPLQAWGGVALDPRRPTRRFPSASALSGLIASALGWRYRDARRVTAMQDHVEYAVREDAAGTVILDYQTAALGDMPAKGWTRWGVETRGGGSARATQILYKEYLADARLTVALGLRDHAPVSIEDVEASLQRPARPLFLGRKACLPSEPLLQGRLEAPTALDALLADAADSTLDGAQRRYWFPAGSEYDAYGIATDVWDRRDFAANRFEGARAVVEAWLPPASEASESNR